MNRNIFEAKDFQFYESAIEMQLAKITGIQNVATPQWIAERANKRLAEIIESWPLVYAPSKDGHWGRSKYGPDCFQARLAFIEEIKPCEHEPEQIDVIVLHSMPQVWGKEFKCKRCGAKLKPVKWEEV